jgi:hypothetical protein
MKNYQTQTNRARTAGRTTPKKAKPDPQRSARGRGRYAPSMPSFQ